ncbi:phenoloxidase-activating factor 2-like [Tribolium madens]|uniref:phenoloxidase-activating factor 2-like n=1 Tax=Tribolium madens TaxID=41895 RepID=UPI001CF7415F|nr:phenoloxidase-activating factor 2-like [Tribolium madens]
MFLFTLILTLPLLTTSRYHHFQYKPRNIQCHCVPQHLCTDEDVTINGHGLLDPRLGNMICANAGEICCDSPPKPETPEIPRCGLSGNIKTRITSNTMAQFGELPWNLIIQESVAEDQNIYKCGGALIHPRVALTAAHCVSPYLEEPEKILVRAGEWNIDSRDESLPFQDSSVEEILIHYDYSSLSLKNDVAILILVEDFVLRDNVKTVCLSSSDNKVVENGCLASGWGQNAHSKGRYSSTLKKVQVPIVPRSHCLEALRRTRLGPRYNLHKSFICAGGKKGQDSCKGDGGSPLICPLLDERERFVQIGIVSWGIGCGGDGIPGVYVNVPLYLEWIEGEMEERDLDTRYFKI